MDKTYRTAQCAKQVNRHPDHIRRPDLQGRFPARQTRTGRRYCKDADVARFPGADAGTENRLDRDRGVLPGSRVSRRGQMDDLEAQVAVRERFCQSVGIAGGLHYKRKVFLHLMARISALRTASYHGG